MLKVLDVTKKYGKLKALKNVSFELKEGTITILLGPNGAGKSTLMKAAIGFLKYDGEITLNGMYTKNPEARRDLGYIPELPALYPNLTVYEHMEFIARAYKMKGYKDRIDYLLNTFELADKKKKFGDELSKGMQQKLNLCLGLLPNPKMILLDEPMIGLDPHAIRELKKMLLDMKANGATILVSTHIIDTIDELWDRAIIMQDGVIKSDVLKEDLIKSNTTLTDTFFDVTEGLDEEAITVEDEDYDKVIVKEPKKKSLFSRKGNTL